MPTSVVTGQIIIVTTCTPVQLPTFPLRNGVVLKASVANAQPDATANTSAMVGPQNVTMQYDGHGNGYPLSPGKATSFACADASNFWVNGWRRLLLRREPTMQAPAIPPASMSQGLLVALLLAKSGAVLKAVKAANPKASEGLNPGGPWDNGDTIVGDAQPTT